MSVQTACFRVTGEAVTRIARDLVLERDWPAALRLLLDGLHGMDYTSAIAILSGQKRLVGENNDVTLEDEDPAEGHAYRGRAAWIYAGTVRTHGPDGPVYWRPYAYVDNWGAVDVHFNWGQNRYVRRDKVNTIRTRYDSRARSVCYMDDPVEDRCVIVIHPDPKIGALSTLWKRVGAPPLWVHTPLVESHAFGRDHDVREWSGALAAYLAADGALDHRGARQWERANPAEAEWHDAVTHNVWSPNQPRKSRPAAAAEEEPKVGFPGTNVDLFKEMAKDLGMSDQAAEGMALELAGVAPEEDPVVDAELAADCGWVLGDGRFFGCLYFQHKSLALRLLKMLQGTEPADPEKAAERLGWVMIGFSEVTKETIILATGNRVTDRQKATVLAWCQKHGVDTGRVDLLRVDG